MDMAIMRNSLKLLLGAVLASGFQVSVAQQAAAAGHAPAVLSQKWEFIDKYCGRIA